MQNKKELRQLFRKIMNELEDNLKEQYQSSLLEQVVASEQWQKARTVAMTISMANEVQTGDLMQAAREAGKIICVPRTLPQRQMSFSVYNDGTKMVRSSFGVNEPSAEIAVVDKNDIDLLVVPGQWFDGQGYRVGHGGGYYDRFLVDYNGDTISLVYPETYTRVSTWEIDQFDIPVDQVFVAN